MSRYLIIKTLKFKRPQQQHTCFVFFTDQTIWPQHFFPLFLSKMVVGMQGLVKKESKLNMKWEKWSIHFTGFKGLGRVHILFLTEYKQTFLQNFFCKVVCFASHKEGRLTIIGNKLKNKVWTDNCKFLPKEAIMITLGNKINNSNGPTEAP